MTAREDREKEKTSRENLGKFFYDLAKANFTTNVAGCILSMVMKEKYDDAMVWGLLSFGLASTAILAYVGFRILKKISVMEGLIIIYATITVVAGAMALWLHTKWGKKFLENL